jgi:hypothetical protein
LTGCIPRNPQIGDWLRNPRSLGISLPVPAFAQS